ncbi:MAG TPA: hypothetical protein VFG19_11560 [Geobacteraceae bacterium]|nr:hypothetical protein [Geobacteraceae bacterium]
MKKTALCITCVTSVLVFAMTPVHAAGKKTVFNTESIKYKSGTGAERCQDKCSRRSGPDVKSLLSEGWKIVSSTSKAVIAEQYWYAPCNNCEPHECICMGTEYILQKDEPASKIVETKSEISVASGKDNRTVMSPTEVEPSKNELDLLKKENELLKQENASLKKEIETLRNQLSSRKK